MGKMLAQNRQTGVEMVWTDQTRSGAVPVRKTMKTSAELEQQAALQVASLMAAAARTAPKTRGIDNIRVIGIEDPGTKAKLVRRMRELAKSEDRPWFERDASCVEKSLAVLLIG